MLTDAQETERAGFVLRKYILPAIRRHAIVKDVFILLIRQLGAILQHFLMLIRIEHIAIAGLNHATEKFTNTARTVAIEPNPLAGQIILRGIE